MRECFCFGSEAVNASGEAVRGLVKSRVRDMISSQKNQKCGRVTSVVWWIGFPLCNPMIRVRILFMPTFF